MVTIRIEHLQKSFGSHVALRDVSLTIEAGEMFFLLGPSGCGKTTLLRSIAGFHSLDGGRILFGEEDVTARPVHERKVAMMFQSYALWPHLTAAGNIAFGLEERGVPRAERRQRVREALASVQLDGLGDRRIAQLSGGQQQRVALARALVVRPRALLLDEPLSNLDAKLRTEMRQEIRRICKESGLTAVYVTHDQNEALSIADRLAILGDGEIGQIGTPEEVYRRPHSRAVADFIGESNFLEGTVREIDGPICTVETAAGPFRGQWTSPKKPSHGGRAILSIRPECWRLSTAPEGANCVPGRLEGTVYLGEVAQQEFVSGVGRLKILQLNPKTADAAGEEQYAIAAPEDVVVLPE